MAELESATDSSTEAIPEIPELDNTTADTGNLERIPVWVQSIWTALGFGGFFLTVYTERSSFPFHPKASLAALAWLAFSIVGIIVNRLEQAGFPGGKISFRTRLGEVAKAAAISQKSVSDLSAAIAEYAEMLQSWTKSVNLFIEHLERYGTDDEKKYDILARFCLERMEEARELIGEAGDKLRFSFWWYAEEPEGNGLRLLFSDDIRDDATLNHRFEPGAGLMGQCYIEDRAYNLHDAPSSIYYERIRENPEYHGLLLVPVKAKTNGEVIGVLSIDRLKKETFPTTAENVAHALTDLLAFAMQSAL